MAMRPAAEVNEPIKRIVIVDPNSQFSVMLRSVLGKGYDVEQVRAIREGAERLRGTQVDVVLLNWDWPRKEKKAGELCQELLKQAGSLSVPVVAMTSDDKRETAMQIVAQGAYDVFTQPLNVFELKKVIDRAFGLVTLARALAEARGAGAAFRHIPGLVGNSKPMQRAYDLIQKVAGVSTTVLIRGESGTGKEVVARAIHRLSLRAEKPFMAFSPSALPESLIQDELFGHEAGGITGATHARRGRFEEAQGGTVFLDEIGDLSQTSSHPGRAVPGAPGFIGWGARGHSADLRDRQKSGPDGRARFVPPRPLFSHFGVQGGFAAASPAPRRHSIARRIFLPAFRAPAQQGGARDEPRPCERPGQLRLAGQRAGAAERH